MLIEKQSFSQRPLGSGHWSVRKVNTKTPSSALTFTAVSHVSIMNQLWTWRPCLLSGKSPYKELLPTSCLVGPAPTRCRWSHRRAGQYAGKEPMWCSGSARCLPGVDSRTSPPPPASRDVFLILPCCQSYHDKYKCSYNYVSLLFSKEGDDGSANIAGFHILSHSFLRA